MKHATKDLSHNTNPRRDKWLSRLRRRGVNPKVRLKTKLDTTLQVLVQMKPHLKTKRSSLRSLERGTGGIYTLEEGPLEPGRTPDTKLNQR